MWIIEDKGGVFAKPSIKAIIDSEPYDLYHRQLLLATILQIVKNKGNDFRGGESANIFPIDDLSKYLLVINLQIMRVVLPKYISYFLCDLCENIFHRKNILLFVSNLSLILALG